MAGYFDSMNLGNLNKALALSGSQYQVPQTSQMPMTQPAAPAAPLESALPKLSATPPMPAVDPELSNPEPEAAGGGVADMLGGLTGGGGAPAPAQDPATMTAEQRGAANQQQAMSKIGSAIGAVGNFYTGNWLGALNNVKGITGG